MTDYTICPTCQRKNSVKEKYCLDCGQKLIYDEEKEIILENKVDIPKDKIILLDLNYTLISNSWPIRHDEYPDKIFNRQYEHELANKIKDNYVILITASPDYTASDSLKHIEENTDLEIAESYWNFGNQSPPELKEYWLKKEVLPRHGADPSKYLAIESNEDTRDMYAKYNIEARPKWDFINYKKRNF